MMRSSITMIVAAAFALSLPATAMAQQTEQEIVDEYLRVTETKHVRKLGWASVNFGMNRINRNNDYNRFVVFENSRISGAEFSWMNLAPIIGVDFGVAMSKKIVWTFGGEYWLNFGETLEGTFSYNASGTPVNITNPTSKITTWGIFTGAQYYVMNPPSSKHELQKPAVRVGGTVGYYAVRWDLFPEFENLNLSTSTSAGVNTTYIDQSIGITLNLGVDLPVGIAGFILAADIDAIYLNFDRVAWYNTADQEIVASFDGGATNDSRVDLAFTGIRSKLQIKRFFTW